jgi:hypothetical protein
MSDEAADFVALQNGRKASGCWESNPCWVLAAPSDKVATPCMLARTDIEFSPELPGRAEVLFPSCNADALHLLGVPINRSRHDRSPVRLSRSIGGARRGRAAAGARRNNQGDRQSVPAALLDHARHSDLGRGRRTRPLHVGLVRLLRAQGHAERQLASSTAPWCRPSPLQPCAGALPISASMLLRRAADPVGARRLP